MIHTACTSPGTYPSMVSSRLIQNCAPSPSCKKTPTGGRRTERTTRKISAVLVDELFIGGGALGKAMKSMYTGSAIVSLHPADGFVDPLHESGTGANAEGWRYVSAALICTRRPTPEGVVGRGEAVLPLKLPISEFRECQIRGARSLRELPAHPTDAVVAGIRGRSSDGRSFVFVIRNHGPEEPRGTGPDRRKMPIASSGRVHRRGTDR